jgi:predicted nucleic acid-binding protein
MLRVAGLSVDELVLNYARMTEIVDVSRQDVPRVVIADPDDDHVIACAVAAQADMVVSGDQHLLSLGAYRGIPILGTAQALQRIGSGRGRG